MKAVLSSCILRCLLGRRSTRPKRNDIKEQQRLPKPAPMTERRRRGPLFLKFISFLIIIAMLDMVLFTLPFLSNSKRFCHDVLTSSSCTTSNSIFAKSCLSLESSCFTFFKLVKAIFCLFSILSKQDFCYFLCICQNKNPFRVTHVLLRHIVIIYLFDKENTNGTIYQSGTASLWQCSY